MLATIISAIASILVCVLTCVFGMKQAKLKQEIEVANEATKKRGEQRKKESLLSMKLAHANTQLTVGVAYAIKNGHANGEIESGLDQVNKASAEYNEFLQEMANEHLQ